VQVVSFVAKGTIEEGMLSVLGFKRSLFAGVLDGGEREVFLGGSRLTRFVESVENVTAGIPAPLVEEADGSAAAEPAAAEATVDGDIEAASAPPRPPADPLSNLLRTGLDLLTQFAAAAGTDRAMTGATPSPLFEHIRDEARGPELSQDPDARARGRGPRRASVAGASGKLEALSAGEFLIDMSVAPDAGRIFGMPTRRPPSTTGSAPIRCVRTRSTASETGTAGPIVMTDGVMTRSMSSRSRR
jgi:hypothetical protein